MHRVAELALVLEHGFQPVEIAPGAVLDQRTPEIDQLLGRRRWAAMHRLIVAGNSQCNSIGMAAQDRRLALTELARRLRQPHFPTYQAGTLGGERHFEIGLARDLS